MAYEKQNIELYKSLFRGRTDIYAVRWEKDGRNDVSISYQGANLIEKGLNIRQIKAVKYLKENNQITNKIYQELCDVSKATATRDLTELIDKYKLLERFGEVGAGTLYKLIGS